MRCAKCDRQYPSTAQFCADDGLPLIDPAAADADRLIGARIAGRFVAIRRLGRCGFGSVYLAVQLSVDRLVAVKVISPELAADEEVRARFVKEARSVSRLNSPFTVRLLDFGELDADRLFYVMEYIDGEPLRKALNRDRLRPIQAIELVDHICQSLQEAHEAGIVHRDIKPENVMLQTISGRDLARLLDFGVARILGESSELTQDGSVMGTAAYMAPEQAAGAKVGPPADIYALGVILFELLAGERPFNADGALALLFAHVNHAPPSLLHDYPDRHIPRPLAELVHEMLAKDPAKRPPSAAAVRARLQAARAQLAAQSTVDLKVEATPPEAVVSTPTRQERRRGPSAATLVILALASAAVSGALLWGLSETEDAPDSSVAPTLERDAGALPATPAPLDASAKVPDAAPPDARPPDAASPDAAKKRGEKPKRALSPKRHRPKRVRPAPDARPPPADAAPPPRKVDAGIIVVD